MLISRRIVMLVAATAITTIAFSLPLLVVFFGATSETFFMRFNTMEAALLGYAQPPLLGVGPNNGTASMKASRQETATGTLSPTVSGSARTSTSISKRLPASSGRGGSRCRREETDAIEQRGPSESWNRQGQYGAVRNPGCYPRRLLRPAADHSPRG
jgi:hypothetical protein